MTAADKLRELLATRPAGGSLDDLLRWWNSAPLVTEALDDYALERVQHQADNEGSVTAIATEAHEKSILERERDAYRSMLCDVIASAHPNERDHPAMSRAWRAAGELLKNGPEPFIADPEVDDESRCAVCQWPLVEDAKVGCVRGNCSQRPRPKNLYAPERAAKELHQLALRNGMPPSGRWA